MSEERQANFPFCPNVIAQLILATDTLVSRCVRDPANRLIIRAAAVLNVLLERKQFR